MSYMLSAERRFKFLKRFNSRPAKRTITWHSIPIKIEIDKGDTKEGYDESGNPWSHEYKFPYGEIPSTHALSDGDPVDIYIGESSQSTLVYVIHQRKKNGSFDEDKCFLNFPDRASAILAYKQHGPAWGFGSMDQMTVDQFIHGYLASNRKW